MTSIQFGLLGLAVMAGLTGGITFAFSNFIMKAFDRLPRGEAIRAMQAINLAVYNPLFMLVFMGTGGIAIALAIAELAFTGVENYWTLTGTLVYAIGVCGITAMGNVPLNNQLATATGPNVSTETWDAFAGPWVSLNHIRVVAAALASLAFMVAAL